MYWRALLSSLSAFEKMIFKSLRTQQIYFIFFSSSHLLSLCLSLFSFCSLSLCCPLSLSLSKVGITSEDASVERFMPTSPVHLTRGFFYYLFFNFFFLFNKEPVRLSEASLSGRVSRRCLKSLRT